jgi:hypothetical protein
MLCALMLVLGTSRMAAAQSGDMGQGEAAIAVRSDVKLSVKGTGGTPTERLAKLGQAVSDQMGEIRGCYRKQVASSPEVMGTLRLRLGLEKDKKPVVEVLDRSGASETLLTCVQDILTRAKYTDVGRPAAALLSLAFENSRARGQAQMEQGAAAMAHSDVQMKADGAREAAWSTDGDQVRFTVRAEPDAPQGTVQTLIQGFKRGYAGFLDCRRKCEQGGLSPEGDIAADLSLDAKGKLAIKLGTITVKHQRAPGCSERAFKRVTFDRPEAPIKAQVNVHFAP